MHDFPSSARSASPRPTLVAAVFFALLAPAFTPLVTARAADEARAPVAASGMSVGVVPGGIAIPAKPTPTMPVDQVRIGMKGYGLSVFHGVKIEPFPVEVVSVMSDFAPHHPVIWIRCPDERMQQSGAVQGMSGSPIFLWDANEPQVAGKGGRLIGAFAFGYGSSLDCFVGVQPIAHMRAVGDRIEPAPKAAAAIDSSPVAESSLKLLLSSPAIAALPSRVTWQAKALNQLLEGPGEARGDSRAASPARLAGNAAIPTAAVPGLPAGGQVQHLMLPLAVGSARTSALLQPLLAPMGIIPLADRPNGSGRTPPPGIDPDAIRLEPGSVLAIPLGWGDSDLSASGTVTDVLPDGQVLAFGHAMYGQGNFAVPMATGFVHVVMPSRQISFKMANTAVIRGTVVRDEQSAIAGVPATRFTSAPVSLDVNIPGQPQAHYNYNIVQLKALTPTLAGIVCTESLTSWQNMPQENTARIRGKMVFAGGRVVPINAVVPDLSLESMMMQIVPPVAVMTQNPLESMPLQSMSLEIDIEPSLRVGSIVSGRLDRKEVAPGENASLSVRIQPYGKPAFERRLTIAVPESLPDGEYQLSVCDAQNYLQSAIMSRPHIMSPASGSDLFSMVQTVLGVASDSIYLVLQSRQEGLVVGQEELPRLPSSRRALIASPTNSIATSYTELVSASAPIGLVVDGNLGFTITVNKKLAQR
ncbi:MAG: hypothetical protein NTW19_00910 [Planctomycetota bacterium]|nr:hypothetical protein [Planctomycetota bacterium]